MSHDQHIFVAYFLGLAAFLAPRPAEPASMAKFTVNNTGWISGARAFRPSAT
jgi:hypothetical protein